MNQPMPSSSPKWILPGLLVLVAALILIGTVFRQRVRNVNTFTNTALNGNVTTVNTPAPINQNSNTSVNTNIDQGGWKIHRSEELNFSLRYPPQWSVQTIGPDGALNRRPYDVVLSEGTCPREGACDISSGSCRVVIGRLANPLTTETDTETVLNDLRSKAKAAIETVSFQSYTAYRTKVNASPPDEQGEQLLGTYYLLSLKERFLRAHLDSGYLRQECDTVLASILSTLTQ